MAYGAAAGSIVKLIQKLIGQHGIRKGMSMARKLGFPTKKINQAAKRLTTGRRGPTRADYSKFPGQVRKAQPMDPRIAEAMGRAQGRLQAQPMNPKIAAMLRGVQGMRGRGQVPLPGVAETGRAQLARISRASRGMAQPLSPDVARVFNRNVARPMDPAMGRKLSNMAGMRGMPRPKVPQAYKRALKGTPLMKMLGKVNPENRGQALKLLMQMGLLGAGGAAGAKMIAEREGQGGEMI